MIRRDRARGLLVGEDLSLEEVAELDARLERVAPDRLEWRDPRPHALGLGDLVKRLADPVAQALGIRPCSPCEERRRRLNELFPFGRDSNPPPGAGKVPG